MTEKMVHKVPDIDPYRFFVEIVDDKQNPIKEVEFSYSIDGRETKTATTDEHGILNVQPIPQNEVKLSFPK